MKKHLSLSTLTLAAVLSAGAVVASDADTNQPHTFVKDSVVTTKVKANLAADHASNLAKIHVDVSKALDLPETRQFFKTNRFERVDLSPQDFGKLVQSDLKHWTALINAVGAKID